MDRDYWCNALARAERHCARWAGFLSYSTRKARAMRAKIEAEGLGDGAWRITSLAQWERMMQGDRASLARYREDVRNILYQIALIDARARAA